jgi:signal transduction histidine kinase
VNDGSIFAVSVLAGVGFVVLRRHDEWLAPWLLITDGVGGVLACLSLWVRRRWPFGVAVFTIALTAFSETAGIASAFGLITVAIRGSIRHSVIATVLGLVTAVVFAWLRPDPDVSFTFNATLTSALTIGILGWGLMIRQRRQLVASLRERAARAETEAALRAEQAQLQAREQIAREMHDVLGHRLSLLSVQAGALEYRKDASASEIATAAGVIRASARQALQDLREVIGVLRAETTELPQPTLADLDDLIAESHRAGMRVALRTELRTDELPGRLGLTAYRIVQEGLTNVRKHAPDADVTVALVGRPGQGLHIEVGNSLPSGRSPTGTGQGLIGLTERALLAGGYLAAAPATTDGRGSPRWLLWAWLPWPA